MPRFEKISGGRVYLRGIDEHVAVGDTVEASGDFAAYLSERGDFREETVDVEAPTDDVADGFDAGAWLDQDYQDRAARVREGAVDDHLDTIADAETSDTVRDAIGERRAELEA
jgi:hypothetical protein